MANVYGADVQALTDLASSFDQAASQLSVTRQSIGSKVQQSAWVGPVADRFRSDWASGNNSRIASAAQLLTEAAKVLRQNADQQTQASAAAGGSLSASEANLFDEIGGTANFVVGLTGHIADFVNGIPKTYGFVWAELNSTDRSGAGILATATAHGTSDAPAWIRGMSSLSNTRAFAGASEVAGGIGTVLSVGAVIRDFADPKASTTAEKVEDSGAAVFGVGAQVTKGDPKIFFTVGGVVWGVGSDLYNANQIPVDAFVRQSGIAISSDASAAAHSVESGVQNITSVAQSAVKASVSAGQSTVNKLATEAESGFARIF